ncbi:MAG: uracil-DNA glycosylase [Bacteroides sp.]|nr:uracil-DNA glycosylase [Bacteroides sp.]MCM1448116.1 uracil-DNA glycosylase [Bacteroides sp.]
MKEICMEESWKSRLSSEFQKPYFQQLTDFVRSEYSTYLCFPPGKQIFNAFDQTPFDKVKVVILGQDPYHGEGQAHGLCFSVCDGVAFPPSLKNIFQEVQSETGAPVPQSGSLVRWAQQGVFLLNTCLSVRAHQAFSHSGHGWEVFTDSVISMLSREREGLVFLLWGAPAGRKASLIDAGKHLILQCAHPSPLSAFRGFFGCGHFNEANKYLISQGKTPIQW